MKCRRCKQDFGSLPSYGIHTRMEEKIGRKKVCPSVERLKAQGMHKWRGQWFFLSPEFVAEHREEIEREEA
jgi:hypothetical protein